MEPDHLHATPRRWHYTDYSVRQEDGPYLDLLKNWKIGIWDK